jgi:hypothetical protein
LEEYYTALLANFCVMVVCGSFQPDHFEAVKKAAEERGVPYQVLLRMFIIEGFKSWQKSA